MTEEKKNSMWDNFKQKVSYTGFRARRWCEENKEFLLAFGPALVAGGFTAYKCVNRSKNTKEVKFLKERKVYDNVNGWYCETKRKLRPDELNYISRRHREGGDTVTEILSEMKLLK